MEKEIKIKTLDNKIIKGTLASSKKPSKNLIVFVHGFTGHRNEHMFFNGSKFFVKNGLDAFRFGLYAEGKETRHFSDTKISLHGEDINTVVKYFRDKYTKIFVIGHSFGGTSLLFVDQKLVDGLVFWDATYVEAKKQKKDYIFNKSLNAYTSDWGIKWVIGKEFVKELLHFKDCGELISKINKPVLFITAEKANMKAGKKYFAKANNPKKLVNIKGADHNFNNFKTEDELFKQTLNWIKSF